MLDSLYIYSKDSGMMLDSPYIYKKDKWIYRNLPTVRSSMKFGTLHTQFK